MGVKAYEAGTKYAGNKLPGQFILRQGCKLKTYQPSYKKGRTIFRPWGQVVKTDQGFKEIPWRNNDGGFGSSFFVQEDVAVGWGVDFRFTALVECSDASVWMGGSPLSVFASDMKRNPAFKYLFDKPANSFAPIDKIKGCGFLRGLLLENMGKNYFQRPIWGVVLMLPASAKIAFENLLNTPASSDAEVVTTVDDPMGWNSKFVVGNPISAKEGKIFEWDDETKFLDKPAAINLTGVGVAPSGAAQAEIHNYACRIFPTQSKQPIPIERIAKEDVPFEDALWYMTGEEQIKICLEPAFGRSCKDALIFTFGGKGLLSPTIEKGLTTHDVGKSHQAAAKAPAQGTTVVPYGPPPSQPEGSLINIDADGGDDEAPFDGGVPTDSANNFPPAPQPPPANPGATGTAASIKARIAAMEAGKKAK